MPGARVDDLRYGERLARHRLHVEVQPYVARADPLDQPACLRRRGEHVGLHRRERFERHDRAGRFKHGHEPGKHLVEMVRGLLVRNAGQQASLFRRPKDEHAAAEISREPGDVAEIRDRPVPHGGIGVRDMKPLRLRQQPVEADAVEPGGGERPPDLCAGGDGNVGDERREREGGDLEAGVATRSRTLAGLRERPVTKRLVADRVAHHTHGSWLSFGICGTAGELADPQPAKLDRRPL